MKNWKKRALRPIDLKRSLIFGGLSKAKHKVYNEDANQLLERISAPIIYADPPYTKRQYSAYYQDSDENAAIVVTMQNKVASYE